MIAPASQPLPEQSSAAYAAGPVPRHARRTRTAEIPAVGACGPPWRDPAHMSPMERLAELAALLAAAWKRLDVATGGEPSCVRPRAPGAARARRGQVASEDRNP
jgi:hypothetical protein